MKNLVELQIGADSNWEQHWIVDSLPGNIGNLKKLKRLTIEYCTSLPLHLAELQSLTHLKVSTLGKYTEKTSIDIFKKLKNLRILQLATQNTYLTKAIMQATKLDSLSLWSKNVPSEIFKMDNLRYLFINNHKAEQDILAKVENDSQLKTLIIYKNRAERISDNIQFFKNLQVLEVTSGNLKYISPKIGSLTQLKQIDFSNNPELKRLPGSIQKLQKLEELKCSQTSILKPYRNKKRNSLKI